MSTNTWVAWLVVALGSVASAQIRLDDLLNAEVPAATHRISYGPEPLQFAELRLPRTTGPHPTVIVIHGGCWVDRLPGLDPRATTFELLRPLSVALTAAGFATWNVEYRRVGNPGGGWPATFLDVGKATDYLRTIGPTYNLNLNRVIVVGHSAGGQLALWIAARPKLPTSSPLFTKGPLQPKAVVDIDGPPNLASFQPDEQKVCLGVPVISQLLGGTPSEQPERYNTSSAFSFLPLGIPQKIVVGGLLKNFGLVGSYEMQAKAKGDTVDVLTLAGDDHFQMLRPGSEQGKAVIEAIYSLRN